MCLLVLVVEIIWNVQAQWTVKKETKSAQKSVSVLLKSRCKPKKGWSNEAGKQEVRMWKEGSQGRGRIDCGVRMHGFS